MAIIKLEKDGYGMLELNNVAFRRDGRVEAQVALDGTDFATDKAENGMLLAVDKKNGVALKAVGGEDLPVGINYSSEHIYDERTPGLKNFALGKDDFFPRIGYLSIGDTFHTNTVCYDDELAADEAALADLINGSTDYYASITSDGSGYWEVISDIAAVDGPVARVLEYTTMPDGQAGLKLQIIKV